MAAVGPAALEHAAPPAQVWAVATLDPTVVQAAEELCSYWRRLPGAPPGLRVFAPDGVADISSPRDHEAMAETVYRLALAACQGRPPPYFSLAGGRKTMSTLLQRAASVFGATQVYHVTGTQEAESRTRGPQTADLLLAGLPPEAADGIRPVALGAEEPFEGLTWSHGGARALAAADYPVTPVRTQGMVEVLSTDGPSLYAEVERRRREASRIAANFFFEVLRADRRENFRSLYRLPASEIDRLRRERLAATPEQEAADRQWLSRLPKADLHCHLGGALAPRELPQVARTVLDARSEVAAGARHAAARCLAALEGLNPRDPLDRARAREALEEGVARWPYPECGDAATAALIAGLSPEWLMALTQPGSGADPAERLRQYQAAGWLQGSSLLRTSEAIGAACRLLYRKALLDGVRYLEVRCSPANCASDRLTAAQALRAVQEGFRAARRFEGEGLEVGLLVIGTRHRDEARFRQHVELAAQAGGSRGEAGLPDVVGFDVAGDESTKAPRDLRPEFEPLFRECVKLTIHAGETEPAERVWEAVYHLNADRIGHGLSLRRYPRLLAHLRDRGTAVELCPTSNDQVVGFRDHWRQGGAVDEYPLRDYVEEGLRVCVCTDNPGISRTSWSGELLKACRLTPGGLSRWDVLGIVRAGFQAAFLPLPERAGLLQRADEEAYRAVAGA